MKGGNTMEKTLKQLFDYQKFAGNARLQAQIDSVRRQPRELILDEAELVSAAGAAYSKPDSERDKESHL